MPIQFLCECGRQLVVPETDAGKPTLCPKCQQHVRIPSPAAVTADRPAAPPTRKSPPPVPVNDVEPPKIEYFAPVEGHMDLFHEAPPEIGLIRSAHTSLAKHVQSQSLGHRLGIAAAITGGIMILFVIGAVLLIINARNPVNYYGIALCLGGIGALVFWIVMVIVLMMTKFEHYCGYVGSEGCALYTLSDSREAKVKESVLLFKDAANLRILSTHHYTKHSAALVYSYTSFEYVWTNRAGAQLFKIAGAHDAHHETPVAANMFHLAHRSELAWTAYLLPRVLKKLQAGGIQQFRLKERNCITLQERSLRLEIDGNSQEFGPLDLAQMQICNGVIALKEPGAQQGWFTDTGIHRFDFADVANAHLFVLLMEHLFGIEVTT